MTFGGGITIENVRPVFFALARKIRVLNRPLGPCRLKSLRLIDFIDLGLLWERKISSLSWGHFLTPAQAMEF